VLPECDPGHVYHLFTVHSGDRDRLQAALAADAIGTLVHYPVAVPRQPAFADLPAASCLAAEAVASRVLSLPLHPALSDADADAVAASILKFRPAPERATASR
jgi:dTDP-4-amino-4,6-dideoxygalactose transaminase